MSQYGVTKIRLNQRGDAVEQVMLHPFKRHLDPERADVELDTGTLANAAEVLALIADGNEVFVMDEVSPHLTDEADPLAADQQGRLASFTRLGHPSAALFALPRLAPA